MTPLEKSIRLSAARWYLKLRENDEDDSERRRFEAWLLADRSHQHAYQAVEATMEDFNSSARLKTLTAAARQDQFFQEKKHQKKINKLGSGIAVMLLCIGLGFFGRSQYMAWQAAPLSNALKRTAIAQLSTHTLDDGSVVTLNANSSMDVTFYRHQRLVKLKHGEAVFEVKKDTARPFVVLTEQAKVTVLGTRFAVNQLSKKVRISVDHGLVEIARADGVGQSLILHNGEVAEITALANPHKVNRPANNGFSFMQGRIVFDRADMFEVADTLSRYRTPTVKALFLGDNTPKVNAVLNTVELEGFLQTLPQFSPVQLQVTHEALVIQPKQ